MALVGRKASGEARDRVLARRNLAGLRLKREKDFPSGDSLLFALDDGLVRVFETGLEEDTGLCREAVRRVEPGSDDHLPGDGKT